MHRTGPVTMMPHASVLQSIGSPWQFLSSRSQWTLKLSTEIDLLPQRAPRRTAAQRRGTSRRTKGWCQKRVQFPPRDSQALTKGADYRNV